MMGAIEQPSVLFDSSALGWRLGQRGVRTLFSRGRMFVGRSRTCGLMSVEFGLTFDERLLWLAAKGTPLRRASS